MVFRWPGISFVGASLPFLAPSTEGLVAAYVVVVAAFVYNLIVRSILLRRASSLIPYVTALGDSLLCITMLTILGGGFDSPFSYFVFAIIVSIAMRFGYGPSLAVTGIFIAVNVVSDLSNGKVIEAPFIFRAGFLGLTALLASYLREQADAALATLKQRNEELHDAYTDLAQAHQELLSVDEMKTNFLANVSHELRTPLTSIRSFSELLITDGEDPEIRQEFLGIINTESERLTRLVSDVLDISKIESGHMTWQVTEVDLSAVLHESARTYGPVVTEHGLVFEQDIRSGLPVISGDRDRLQQVVVNLLNNAVKFTPIGTIRLSAVQEDDEVRISVSDTGIGIAPDDQKHIFEKFHQVGPVLTNKPKGTGLGLAICRDIVEHHKGQIWVESEPGAGSKFIFTLPAERVAVDTVTPILDEAREAVPAA